MPPENSNFTPALPLDNPDVVRLSAAFPLKIGDADSATKLPATLYISACGLSKTAQEDPSGVKGHAIAICRFEGAKDNPHRIQILADRKDAGLFQKGIRFVNPTVSRAVTRNDEDTGFRPIDCSWKQTDGGLLCYHPVYLTAVDKVILAQGLLAAPGNLIREAMSVAESEA